MEDLNSKRESFLEDIKNLENFADLNRIKDKYLKKIRKKPL